MKNHYEFHSLDQEQRLAVRQTATSLLYGYVDAESASQPPLSGVIRFMISAAHLAQVNLFYAPDLIVCPDTTVEFKNIPAFLFNNILIYSSGQIITRSKAKIRAVQIQHINA